MSTILWPKPYPYFMMDKIFVPLFDQLQKLQVEFQEMKLEVHPNKLLVKTYLHMIFGNTVSENKRFVFDIHCKFKSASFRPINNHLEEISPWSNNSWSRTHSCSNDLVQNYIIFIYAHVNLGSTVQTCCDDYSNVIHISSSVIFPLTVH